MANRYIRPILFAFEPDVVLAFANISFGASGAPTLNQGPYPNIFSKGFCAISANTISTTATLTSSSASVTGAASLAGVFNGMSVTGTGIPSNTTVSSVDPSAGTLTLSNDATASGSETLTFSGGQYILQLGRQAGINLDTYNHLLGVSPFWDVINVATGSTPPAPTAPNVFLVGNQVSVRTIPALGNSPNTDATITIQCGTGAGSSFTAAVPASGDVLRLALHLTRSGAI